MDWLDRLLGATRARLIRLVRGRAASINEMAAGVGITDNAVRGHVAALQRDGLMQARSQRPTGGKPARLYELTPEAEELFPKAYALVLTELLAKVREERGEAAMLALLRDVGRRLGAGGMAGHAGMAGRVAAASALLESLGGSIEAEQGGAGEGWQLRSAGCPLSRVVVQTPEVCSLVESLVAETTQCEVREICDRSGLPKCAFHIREPEARAS